MHDPISAQNNQLFPALHLSSRFVSINYQARWVLVLCNEDNKKSTLIKFTKKRSLKLLIQTIQYLEASDFYLDIFSLSLQPILQISQR